MASNGLRLFSYDEARYVFLAKKNQQLFEQMIYLNCPNAQSIPLLQTYLYIVKLLRQSLAAADP